MFLVLRAQSSVAMVTGTFPLFSPVLTASARDSVKVLSSVICQQGDLNILSRKFLVSVYYLANIFLIDVNCIYSFDLLITKTMIKRCVII